MSKSPSTRNNDENPEAKSKPKRRLEKSLPMIQNRKVPLHQIQSKKMHSNPLDQNKQLQFWAYVPTKSIEKHKKSNSSLSAGEATIDLSRSNETVDPSLTLLDKYFQRKHQTRLKDVIKFIEDAADYTSDSVGYEEIRIFQNIIKKRQNALSLFNSTKRKKLQKTESFFDQTGRDRRSKRNTQTKARFNPFIEGYKNSQIDNYFLDDRIH